jgi:hypothetical protein
MALLTEGEVRARARAAIDRGVLPRMKVYPRGFLGAALEPRAIKQHGLAESNRGFSMRDYNVMVDQNKFDVSNPAIEELFNTYLLDREKAEKFEFRQQVYHVALRAFGAPNFLMWFQAQYGNPSAGELHGRFLADTLKFLTEGRRAMSLETWASIIVIDSGADPIGRLPQTAIDFFGIGKNYRRDVDWPNIVQTWCSQPGGLEDLVGSLHILFGSPAVI